MTTQLMNITELVNSGDVQLKVLNGAKECFCALVAVFIALTVLRRGGYIF